MNDGGRRVRQVPLVELSTLAKIESSELRLLWVNDWYDGPLEAVVEHAGSPCLMVLHNEDAGSERPYTWLVIRLTAEQRADEERWHGIYAAHVGDHWCFHDAAVEHPPPPVPPRPDDFFAQHRQRPPLDMRNNVVVGWADEMPAR
jgi:hypothetical protein